jgi:hypothetical protein
VMGSWRPPRLGAPVWGMHISATRPTDNNNQKARAGRSLGWAPRVAWPGGGGRVSEDRGDLRDRRAALTLGGARAGRDRTAERALEAERVVHVKVCNDFARARRLGAGQPRASGSRPYFRWITAPRYRSLCGAATGRSGPGVAAGRGSAGRTWASGCYLGRVGGRRPRRRPSPGAVVERRMRCAGPSWGGPWA